MQCGWNPEKSADKEGNTALSLACREAGCELEFGLPDIS